MIYYTIAAAAVLNRIGHKHAYWWIVWPGTVVHETMHYFVGLVTGAEPCDLKLLPEPSVPGQARTIGAVSFRDLNSVNAMPVLLAPFLGIPLVVYIVHHLTITILWKQIAEVFLLGSVMSQARPSGADYELLCEYPFSSIGWGVSAIACAYLYFM